GLFPQVKYSGLEGPCRKFKRFYAERSGSRKRVFRCRPAALQARLRESRGADRAQTPRILREADARTETEEGRGGEAPHEAPVARLRRQHARRASVPLVLISRRVGCEPDPRTGEIAPISPTDT